jgi:hypothetical protein
MYLKPAIVAGALTVLTACAPFDSSDESAAGQPDQSPQTGVSVSGLAYVGMTHRSR